VPPRRDGVTAQREPRARWTLGGIGGLGIPDSILAAAPQLCLRRGERTGHGGGDTGCETGLDCLAVVGAHRRHGLARAAPEVCGRPRPRAAPGPVARVVGDGVGDHARGRAVSRRLHVGADRRAVSLPALHGPPLRRRPGALRRAARCALGLPSGSAQRAVLERRPRCLALVRDGTAGGPRLVVGGLASQCLERARDAVVARLEAVRQLVRGAVALCGVARFARAAVQGHACPRAELHLLPSHRARAPDLPQGLQGVLAAGRQRLGIRPPVLSPPPQRHRPVRLLCPTTTRPQVGERAVEVERQPSSRVSGRPARGSGWGALDAKHRPGEVIDTGIEDTARICCSHVVSEPLREQDRFVAVRAVDKTPASTQRPKSKKVFRDSEPCYSLPKHCVLTQSGAWLGAARVWDSRLDVLSILLPPGGGHCIGPERLYGMPKAALRQVFICSIAVAERRPRTRKMSA
jgi:hypothetical protein